MVSAQYYRNPIKMDLNQIIDSALIHHPEIKNAGLKVLESKTHNLDFLNFKPTEFNYHHGQLFSSQADKNFEIKQNFGSPFSWISKANCTNNQVGLQNAELEITKRHVISKIKSAYYSCIYEMNRLEILKQQKELFSSTSRISDFQFKNKDDSIFEKSNAEMQYGNVQNQLDIAFDDYLIAKNNLMLAAYIDYNIEPEWEELDMIEIAASTDSSERAPGNLFKNYDKTRYKLAESKLKFENSKFFPEFSAGYFFQSINHVNGYQGWQVGISFPLWYFPQRAKQKEAAIEKQIVYNEQELNKSKIHSTTDSYLIELDKLFLRLNYFYDYALKHSDLLESHAKKKLENNEINLSEYLQKLDEVFKTRLEYLKTLDEYNQTAINLELYTY